MTQPLLQAADLRAAAHLTSEAVIGLTRLVEAMHARIAGLPRLRAATADDEHVRGLAGLVHETLGGVTRVVGASAEALLGWLGPALTSPTTLEPPVAEREAVVAALNGVLGDHLAATASPLAISMAFRHAGRELLLERSAMRSRLPEATSRPLVLLHGLCMNDLQWQRGGHDHGESLASESGYTPIYLHYNSGLSVSTNGRVLAPLLERLVDAWPVPIERLVLLAHGMGGLVARSAIHHAALIQRGALRWPARLTGLVCLGTPHQGAPLERGGHGVELVLGTAPYAAPLTCLARLRSAGIQDLRFGNILGGSASDTGTHRSPPVGLPDALCCFAIAANLGSKEGTLPNRLLGDGLVPVDSALGRHHDVARRLAFADDRQAVVHDTGHLDLLSSPEVFGLLQKWLPAQSRL